MSKRIAILDFGSSQVSALVGSRGVNNTLVIDAFSSVKYDGFSNGQFLRPELLYNVVSSAIDNAQKAANMRIKHLFVGVPAEFSACVVREASLSLGRRRKISAIDLEELFNQGQSFLKDVQGFSLINKQPIYYSLDDDRRIIEPIGTPSIKISALLSYILAENKFINFIDDILEGLEIESAEYVSAPLAQAMFLLDNFKRDGSAVLIDIGYITSSVAVVRGDGLLSLSSFSIGGGHIAGDLAKYFGISFSEAESLKRKVMVSLLPANDDVYEIGGKEFDAKTVNKIVCARLLVIAKAITKCLDNCRFELPQTISYCLTGGGISYMRGAKEFISQEIGNEIELINPPIPLMEKSELSSSLGLLDMMLSSYVPTKQKNKSVFKKLLENNI